MQIESIKLKNFRAFRDVEMLNIPQLCVIVGANGTGKSTLFDVFGFLKDCLTYNVSKALQSRGGFKEMISRESNENIVSIELQFRLEIAGSERLVTYLLEISEKKGKPKVNREVLRCKRGSLGKPFHFLDFSNGKGYAVTNEEDFNKTDEELEREEQTLNSPDMLAIKGLGQFQRFKAANAFRELIENWHVSDFHINAARGTKAAAGASDHLSVSGDNVQLVANNLVENSPKIFQKIMDSMKMRVLGIGDRLMLKLRQMDRCYCNSKTALSRIHLSTNTFRMAELKCLPI